MKHTKVVLYIYFFISLIFVGYVIGFKNLVPTETEWIFTTGDLISYYLPLLLRTFYVNNTFINISNKFVIWAKSI